MVYIIMEQHTTHAVPIIDINLRFILPNKKSLDHGHEDKHTQKRHYFVPYC